MQSRSIRWAFELSGCMACMALILTSCGIKSSGGSRNTATNGVGGAAGGESPKNEPQAAGGAGSPVLDVDAGSVAGGPGCDVTCSADLHDVITCNGELIKKCPPETACAAGECI